MNGYGILIDGEAILLAPWTISAFVVTLCTSLYSKTINNMALVLAALAARGRSSIRNISQIANDHKSIDGSFVHMSVFGNK